MKQPHACSSLLASIFFMLPGSIGAQAPAPVPATDSLRIHLTDSPDWAPVKYELVQGDIVLRMTINGQPVSVLFDNGSARTVVDQAFAARAGLPLGSSAQGLTTGKARLTTRHVEGLVVQLPHALTISGSLPAVNLASVSTALGRPIAAVLGGDVIARLATFVRGDTRTIAIRPSGGFRIAGPVVTLPLVSTDQVEGEVAGKPVRLKVDFGFNGAVRLTDTAWRRAAAGMTAMPNSQINADGVSHATNRISTSIRLGQISASAVPIDSGYSGLDVWSQGLMVRV